MIFGQNVKINNAFVKETELETGKTAEVRLLKCIRHEKYFLLI